MQKSGDKVVEGEEETKGLKDIGSDEVQEGRAPRLLKDPGQPSAQERAAHACIHVPFRAWCRECVLGRGRDRQHRRIEDEDGVPRVSMDYMFLTEHGIFGTIDEAEASMQADSDAQRHCLTVMVLKDFRYTSIWAYPVEGKGVSAAEWLITQIPEDLDTCGLDQCRLVLKSDQEPGIVEVPQAIKAARGRAHDHGTAIENSKVGDSNSHARVERAIQEIGGCSRTLKAALESRLGENIHLNHAIVPWIVKHAASVNTRYLIRDCGNTSYKLLKGRQCHEPIAEFGEMVLFKPPPVSYTHLTLPTNREV